MKRLGGLEKAFEVEKISDEEGLAGGDMTIVTFVMRKGILQGIFRFPEDHGVHIVEIIHTPPKIALI
jgi:hypothetical protein